MGDSHRAGRALCPRPQPTLSHMGGHLDKSTCGMCTHAAHHGLLVLFWSAQFLPSSGPESTGSWASLLSSPTPVLLTPQHNPLTLHSTTPLPAQGHTEVPCLQPSCLCGSFNAHQYSCPHSSRATMCHLLPQQPARPLKQGCDFCSLPWAGYEQGPQQDMRSFPGVAG